MEELGESEGEAMKLIRHGRTRTVHLFGYYSASGTPIASCGHALRGRRTGHEEFSSDKPDDVTCGFCQKRPEYKRWQLRRRAGLL